MAASLATDRAETGWWQQQSSVALPVACRSRSESCDPGTTLTCRDSNRKLTCQRQTQWRTCSGLVTPIKIPKSIPPPHTHTHTHSLTHTHTHTNTQAHKHPHPSPDTRTLPPRTPLPHTHTYISLTYVKMIDHLSIFSLGTEAQVR